MVLSMAFMFKNRVIDVFNDPEIYLISINGLSPQGTINTSSIAGYDGSVFISGQLPERNIDLVLGFKCDDAEEAKDRIYRTFVVKSEGTMLYDSTIKTRKIDYLVEKVDVVLTDNPMRAQISLICPQPYFETPYEIQAFMATIVGLWEFPFELDESNTFEFSEITQSLISNVPNEGEYATGCIFVFYALGNCLNPKIEDINTHESIQVMISMAATDVLVINTKLGQKSIIFVHDGVEENVINYKVYGSKFLQLAPGDNEFRYSATENERNLEITCYYTEKYCGV